MFKLLKQDNNNSDMLHLWNLHIAREILFLRWEMHGSYCVSWAKSLNIGRCLLRNLKEFDSCIVWTIFNKWEATPSIYWSFGKSPLCFLWCFGLSNFVSVIIKEQKGLKKRDYLEKCPNSINEISGNSFLYIMIPWVCHDALHVSNNWLYTVQSFKWKRSEICSDFATGMF